MRSSHGWTGWEIGIISSMPAISAFTTMSAGTGRYYHPEYNFRTSENKNAGGKWLQPWIDGDKKDFAADAFAKLLRQNLK